jgi:hypothetical protein
LVNFESDGKSACGSVLVKCTVPEYPETFLPLLSRAVTVKLIVVPAVVIAVLVVTENCVALVNGGGDKIGAALPPQPNRASETNPNVNISNEFFNAHLPT